MAFDGDYSSTTSSMDFESDENAPPPALGGAQGSFHQLCNSAMLLDPQSQIWDDENGAVSQSSTGAEGVSQLVALADSTNTRRNDSTNTTKALGQTDNIFVQQPTCKLHVAIPGNANVISWIKGR